jgi:hypothetical protein
VPSYITSLNNYRIILLGVTQIRVQSDEQLKEQY